MMMICERIVFILKPKPIKPCGKFFLFVKTMPGVFFLPPLATMPGVFFLQQNYVGSFPFHQNHARSFSIPPNHAGSFSLTPQTMWGAFSYLHTMQGVLPFPQKP